jgi:hypothetical protein
MGLASALCGVALVLLMDTSNSVNDPEFALQRNGTAAAFESPEVLQAIRLSSGVAVAVVDFGDHAETMLEWRIVTTEGDAREFAETLRILPRNRRNSGQTATGDGIHRALQLLSDPPCDPEARMIDISTDGESNIGRDPREQRNRAVDMRVRINGLGVMTSPGRVPAEWLRENVTTPPMPATETEPHIRAGFAIDIRDWADFAQAIRRKIVFELAGM